MLLLSGLALATEGLLVAERGDPVADVPAELLLVLHDGGLPARPAELEVDSPDGEVLAVRPAVLPGVWELRVRSAPDVERFRVVVQADDEAPLRLEVPVGERPESGLTGPGRLEALTGEEVHIRLHSDDLPEPQDVRVAAPEGEVLGVERKGDALEIRWQPAALSDPRVVPVGVRDSRRPGAPPEWTVVRLGARVPVSVTTEPGATLKLEVGGRVYGPATAGADGRVSVTVDIRPGETTASATVKDPLGNLQKSTITLARQPAPTLAALVEGSIVPGAPLPPIHLKAVTPTGHAFSAGDPTCHASGGRELSIAEIGSGLWLATLPPIEEDILLDLRVDCGLSDLATVSTRVAVQEGMPARIVLRTWPQELTTDFPVSQVQAWLEDASGDRLEPRGLGLSARHGEITNTEREELSVRAEFQGDLEEPEDAVLAGWNHEPGTGRAATLLIGHRSGESLEVQARALDTLGRPLAEVPLLLALGEDTALVSTDDRGFATADFEARGVPLALVVEAPGLQRRQLVVPWSSGVPLSMTRPDLIAVAPVSIRTGRVRRVTLSTDRPVLLTGTGDTATLTIVLLDASGRPVVDEHVDIVVSEGIVTQPRAQADGSLKVVYAPPPGLSAGEVEIAVTAPDGSFDARIGLKLQPEPVARAPALHAGTIANLGAIAAPYIGLDLEQRLPLRTHVNMRLAVGWYRDVAAIPDVGGDIELKMDLLPVSLSAHRRWSMGLWGAWTGAGLVVTPYRIERTFGGEPGGTELSLHRPGPTVYGGGGYRLRPGELYAELRWLGVSSSAAEYDGQIGGLVAIAGIRVVY
ncbi:MAG TPA: hypothetical protein QGF58_05630 [Myxococcota bacterium]|nr:hypothetical protein [Myxococcota bacterium]